MAIDRGSVDRYPCQILKGIAVQIGAKGLIDAFSRSTTHFYQVETNLSAPEATLN